METKKPWMSITLWSNLIMGLLAMCPVIAPELDGANKAAIIAGVNMVIRYFLTRTGLAL